MLTFERAPALRELRIAEKADPLSAALHFSLRQGLRSIGRLDEAEADCQKMALTDLECSKYTLSRQGKFDEIARIAESRWSGRLLEAGVGSLG